MYRVYSIRDGERRLIAGTSRLRTAQDLITRSAGNPVIPGQCLGRYRAPGEFLPYEVDGVRYEIVRVSAAAAFHRSPRAA